MDTINGKQRIVVLGGGYAGLLAAARIARSDKAAVTLVDAQPAFVQRIRLHELLAGTEPKTLAYGPLLARRGITFVQGRAEELACASQRITGRTAAGQPFDLPYDLLALTLGSRTSAGVAGVAEHAVRLNDQATVRQAGAALRQLAAQGGRVLVAGGGLTGIEVASELAERFPTLRITLALGGRLGAGYAPLAVEHLRTRCAQLEIEVREQTTIQALDAREAWAADGTALPFDQCVWCGGFEAPELARNAGLNVQPDGRMLVDPTLRAIGNPTVFAAGDAAALARADGTLRMGCVSAMPMGAHVGASIRRLLDGRPIEPFSMGFVARCISLGRSDGLLQWTNPDDSVRERVWTRRPAAWVKEAICATTLLALRAEVGAGLPVYRWLKPASTPAVPALLEEQA